MKAKVSRGGGFRGLLNYVLDEGNEATGDKSFERVGGNVSGDTARDIAAEFAVVRSLRPDIKKPAWHCSLSLPAGDKLGSEKWNEIAEDHLRNLGLDPDNRPWIAGRHSDTDHDHIHIITSRIDLAGQVWHGKWEARKAIQSTQELEKKHGLTITPGLDEIDNQGRKKPSSNEIQMAARKNEPLPRVVLQQIVDEALIGDEPMSVFAFMDRIEAAGAKAIPNVASTGRMNGFAFEYNNIRFKASDLGKNYTWAKLKSQGVVYEQDADSAALIERKSQITETIDQIRKGEPASGIEAGEPAGRADGGTQRRVERDDPKNGRGLEQSSQFDEGVSAAAGEADREQHNAAEQVDQVITGHDAASKDKRSELGQSLTADVLDDLDRFLVQRSSDWRNSADYIADLAAPHDSSNMAVQHGSARDLSELKPDHRAKVLAWREQHSALKSPHYRITLMPRRDDRKPFNLGKTKDGEQFYTAAQVESLIPQLRSKNAQGYDIYLTPIDPNYHYMVVDDMDAERKSELEKSNLEPCLIQTSSANNWQAVIKADRHNRSDEQQLANRVVGQLNKRFGDLNFSGVIHPFRMAGFANKKPGRNNVFTQITTAMSFVSQVINDFMNGLRGRADQQLAQERAEIKARQADMAVKSEVNRRISDIERQAGGFGDYSKPDLFKKAWFKHKGLAEKLGWEVDHSALDYRAAKEMLGNGWSADVVESALLEASPTAASHHDPEHYARTTVANAGVEVKAKEAKRPKQNRGPGSTPSMG